MSSRELVNVPDSVEIVSAEALGTRYWRLIKLECWDYERSNGGQYIYGYNESPDELAEMMIIDDGGGTQGLPLSSSSYYVYVSSRTYSAEIGHAASDRVQGMKVSPDGICSYSLWWEWVA